MCLMSFGSDEGWMFDREWETQCHRAICEKEMWKENYPKQFPQSQNRFGETKQFFDWISSFDISFFPPPTIFEWLNHIIIKIQWIDSLYALVEQNRVYKCVCISTDLTTYWEWQNYGDCHKKKIFIRKSTTHLYCIQTETIDGTNKKTISFRFVHSKSYTLNKFYLTKKTYIIK